MTFQPLAVRGPSLHDELPHVLYAAIDGADHSYATCTTELSVTIRRWVGTVTMPGPSRGS
jgi:hypothetical protein